ncbi:MAG TPA: HAD family hydrolase [candidate division Zixibacteria bacterium]|nr:HAD family hydrolase [candidate division Zixibacteria bacterium]
MTIKAVIFDLDGTVTAFNLDYMTVRSEVRGFLIRAGVPASVLFVNESIFDMLNKTEIFMKNNGKSMRALNKVRNEALAIAERHELEAAKTTNLLPSVVETLKTLKEMGLKIGLCTVNSEKSANYILKRFGIVDFFDAVIPRNKVKRVKPSGEHLEAVLKALKVSPKEALLVGDATRDVESARELRVMAVGLSTGVSTQKELMEAGANYLVTSIADLPSLVKTTKLVARQNLKRYVDLASS